MANQEQLDILKQSMPALNHMQAWNQWRGEHPEIHPDFSGTTFLTHVNLGSANLIEADLSGTKLIKAYLSDANLSGTKLIEADLSGANLSGANLIDADLSGASLYVANLYGANLSGAYLYRAELSGANLRDADLSDANLSGANLNRAELFAANFKRTTVGWTSFGDVNFSTVKNLETVYHMRPSSIGIDTIYGSGGNIPEVFLRGAGVPDSFLEYMRSLIVKPIDYYSCFISYSSKDDAFARRLYADLQSNHVRCWFAPEDMDVGDKIRPRIEESIRMYDKLLLVLSEHSIASHWVAYEVERALNKEPQGKPNVLYPIRLDDSVMESKASWADDIKSTRHIGDFTHWKNHDDYQKAFDRLIRALKAK